MSVELSGNSPAALTAGILLLSRARQFGQRLSVSVMGDPDQITPIEGPALVHSAVLASCGVGSRPGGGAVVVVPGPSEAPLAVCLSEHGIGGWFTVDRSGRGEHPATQALIRMCRSPDGRARRLGRELLQGVRGLGCMVEPAVIDLLLQAPVSPFQRATLGLRAGRALFGGRAAPAHDFLARATSSSAPTLPMECTLEQAVAVHRSGDLDAALQRVRPAARAGLSTWVGAMLDLAATHTDAEQVVCAVLDTIGPVLSLPGAVVLPKLNKAADGVARCLTPALAAQAGNADAARDLVETFQFLGGKFVAHARFPVVVPGDAPPEGRLARWRWFSASTHNAAATADTLWRRVIDPVQ